jgi:hypothetical protein
MPQMFAPMDVLRESELLLCVLFEVVSSGFRLKTGSFGNLHVSVKRFWGIPGVCKAQIFLL